MNNLAIEGFLSTPAGIAVLAVAFSLLAVFLIALTYRYFSKALLDIIISAPLIIIVSPLVAVVSIYCKAKFGKVLDLRLCIGKSGKLVYLHNFACGGALKKLPQIIDVFLLKLSIVGPKIMPAGDAALLEDEDMERFFVRPGLISPAAAGGAESYEEMFEKDKSYCDKVRITKDIYIFLCATLAAIRGEGCRYLGEANGKSYADVLLERGTISEEDVKQAYDMAQNAKIR